MRSRILTSLLLITALILPTTLIPNKAAADSSFTVLLVDLYASSRSSNSVNLAESASAIITSLNPSNQLVIGTTDPSEKFSPILGDARQINQSVTHLFSDISSYSGNSPSDLLAPLSQTFELLISDSAPSGTQIYFITSEPDTSLTSDQIKNITALLARFQESSWHVNFVSLNSPSNSTNVLQGFAAASGGSYISATSTQELKSLANTMLQSSGQGALFPASETSAATSQTATYTIPVAPQTSAANFFILKDSASVAGTVVDPSGNQVSSSDPNSLTLDTPLATIVHLTSPTPGDWLVKLQGSSNAVTAWYSVFNPLHLVVESLGPFPQNEPTILSASIKEGTNHLTLSNVKYFAELTTPSGKKTVYSLNDLGLDGDKTPGDGIYSVRIPPLTENGSYKVALQLQWLNYDGAISATSQFSVQPFPSADIELLPTDGLQIGKTARIASITVNVGGQPYPVTPDQITATVTASDGTTMPAQIEANQIFGEGRAWGYYATIIPEKSGQQTLNLEMKVNYLGRDYVYFAKPLLFTVPALPVLQQPSKPFLPFPFWVLIPIIVVLLLLFLSISWLHGARPYGYLYDDKGNELVRFRDIRRNPIMNLLFKNSLYGSEVGVQALDSAIFHFTNRGVELIQRRSGATVRVDNEPVINRKTIEESAWIGSQGKLYIYATERELKPETARPENA